MEALNVGALSTGAFDRAVAGVAQRRTPAVTRGAKLLLIALLALSMSLLALFVDSLTAERRANLESARQTAQVEGRSEWLVPAYQSVERSLKYAPLFLGSVFLAYFLFEISSGMPMHMAQYVLVGVAQLIFYLLLLSFAERIGFDAAFLLAGGSTVTLLGWNAGWIFKSARQRWRALGIFGALYAIIYALLRLENYALLLGSVCSFGAIAAAMYRTRGLDWYGAGAAKVATKPAAEVQ